MNKLQRFYVKKTASGLDQEKSFLYRIQNVAQLTSALLLQLYRTLRIKWLRAMSVFDVCVITKDQSRLNLQTQPPAQRKMSRNYRCCYCCFWKSFTIYL